MIRYPHADRANARALIKRLGEFMEALEHIATGKREFNADFAAILTQLTGTSDLMGQHKALSESLSRVKAQHERRLIEDARYDLSAFAEVIRPSEPPARHHIFMCEQLHEVTSTPDGKMMVSMPPGHAKDLDVETPVMMGDGTYKRLGDIEVGDMVITHRGRPREVLETHDQGVRPVLRIVTATGRVVNAHPEHPFLTPSGWKPASELRVNSTVALVREYEIANSSGRSIDEFALAGYMIAAAIVRGRVYSRMKIVLPKFRTDDFAVMDDVLDITKRLGFNAVLSRGNSYGSEVRTVSFDDSFSVWLKRANLYKAKRRAMRIPDWVFQGDERRIAAFLGAIVACDATLVPRPSKHSGKVRLLQVMIRNAGLAVDLQRLFMRIGARGKLSELNYSNYNYKPTKFIRLTFEHGEDQAYLAARLRIRGSTKRFWDAMPEVERFFDGHYAEDKVVSITPAGETETRCLTVDEDHSFLAEGIIVHNSTYFSHLYPAWYLGGHEGKKYLQAGHTQKFVEKQFCARVKAVIDSENYRKVFPDVFLTVDQAAEFALTNNAEYVSKGVGQGIAGYRSNVNGVDDPYASFKTAQSPTVREATWEWFANDFSTRLLPGGSQFVVATRWHDDDIPGHLEDLMKKGLIDPWVIINLPAYSLGEAQDVLSRPKDEPLWPEVFNRQYLENQRNTMSDIRWSCLYQGMPILDKGNILQRSWLHYYERAPILLTPTRHGDPAQLGYTVSSDPNIVAPGDPANRYLGETNALESDGGDPENPAQEKNILQETGGGDPADFAPGKTILPGNAGGDPRNFAPGKTIPEKNRVFAVRTIISIDSAETVTQRSDNSAIQAWRLGSDGNHYLCDVLADRWDFPTLVEMAYLMARRWGANGILVETKGAGNQFIQANATNPEFPIFPFNPGRDSKEFRFEGTMMLWRTGKVLLPEHAPWLGSYLDELLKFPSGKRDDNVDATSQYLKWSQDGGAYRRGTAKLGGRRR